MLRYLQIFSTMHGNDFFKFATSMAVTLIIGTALLVFLFRLLAKPQEEQREGTRRIIAKGNDNVIEEDHETDVPVSEKRIISSGAAAALLHRAKRFHENSEFTDALKCYLSLLYGSVEKDQQNKGLPTYLIDCLRGCALCYRALGLHDKAVAFLQAERTIYEEMIAEASNVEMEKSGGKIISSLLQGRKGNNPRRCTVLSEVADASLRHGYNNLGLSYRVKAAALKHRISGEALDPQSKEFQDLAGALEKCSENLEQVTKSATDAQAKISSEDVTTNETSAKSE